MYIDLTQCLAVVGLVAIVLVAGTVGYRIHRWFENQPYEKYKE